MAESRRERAVLVAVQLPSVSDAAHEADRVELARLVKTLGLEVVATVSQRRSAPSHGTVLGVGKLLELARWTGGAADHARAPRPGEARRR
jgi:GTP-binding protein HflX